MPSTCTGTPPLAWCSRNEAPRRGGRRAAVAVAGGRHSAVVARGVFSRALPAGAPHEPRRSRDRAAAILPALRLSRRVATHARQLPIAARRPAVHRQLLAVTADRRRVDAALSRGGVSHGLRHRAQPPTLAHTVASARHPALLVVVPAAHLCVDGLARHPRGGEHPAAGGGADRAPDRSDVQQCRHLSRHRLHLSAVHGAPALCGAGEARGGTAGGGARPRCETAACLHRHHAAALPAGRDRGIHAGVHPGDR